MPWTGAEFKEKHNKGLSNVKAEKAAAIANAILKQHGDEGAAIAIANSLVGEKKQKRKPM